MASSEYASNFASDLHLHLTFSQAIQNSGLLECTSQEKSRPLRFPIIFNLDDNSSENSESEFEFSNSRIRKLMQIEDSWSEYYHEEFASDYLEKMRLVDPTTLEEPPLKATPDNNNNEDKNVRTSHQCRIPPFRAIQNFIIKKYRKTNGKEKVKENLGQKKRASKWVQESHKYAKFLARRRKETETRKEINVQLKEIVQKVVENLESGRKVEN